MDTEAPSETSANLIERVCITCKPDLYNVSMFLFCKPSAPFVGAFLEAQAKLDLTYPAVGATAATPPLGYVVDHTRIQVGSAKTDFTAGKAALRRWEQFRLGWVEPCRQDTPVEAGQVVGILGRYCALWSLNACRVVYVVDE